MSLEFKDRLKQKGWKRFLKSFKNSWNGLCYAYRYEQSMTIHNDSHSHCFFGNCVQN